MPLERTGKIIQGIEQPLVYKSVNSEELYSSSASSHLAGKKALRLTQRVEGISWGRGPLSLTASLAAGSSPFLANCGVIQREMLWFINPQESRAVTLDSSGQLRQEGEAAGRKLLCHGTIHKAWAGSLSYSQSFCPVSLN